MGRSTLESPPLVPDNMMDWEGLLEAMLLTVPAVPAVEEVIVGWVGDIRRRR